MGPPSEVILLLWRQSVEFARGTSHGIRKVVKTQTAISFPSSPGAASRASTACDRHQLGRIAMPTVPVCARIMRSGWHAFCSWADRPACALLFQSGCRWRPGGGCSTKPEVCCGKSAWVSGPSPGQTAVVRLIRDTVRTCSPSAPDPVHKALQFSHVPLLCIRRGSRFYLGATSGTTRLHALVPDPYR